MMKRVLVVLLLLVSLVADGQVMRRRVLPSVAGGPVTYGVTSSGSATSTTTLSFSHTVTSSGSNRAIFACVSWYGNVTISSVTYNSVGLTAVVTANNGTDDHSAIYRLVNPATGAHTLALTVSGNAGLVMSGVSFTGVNQTTPARASAANTGNNATSTVTVASATGDIVLDVSEHHWPELPPHTPGGGQTSRWDVNNDGTNDMGGMGSTKAGAASVTPTWGITNTRTWAACAVSIQP